MKVTFRTTNLEALYSTPISELGKQQFSREIIIAFRKKIDLMKNVGVDSDLTNFRSLGLEKLKDDYEGYKAIRVNKQYRIIFTEGPEDEISVLILELSKHYQ